MGKYYSSLVSFNNTPLKEFFTISNCCSKVNFKYFKSVLGDKTFRLLVIFATYSKEMHRKLSKTGF